MAHTHTFELDIEGVGKTEGEMSFNGPNNQPPHVFIRTPLDVDVSELERVSLFFKQLVALYRSCGTINKIEIVKKV